MVDWQLTVKYEIRFYRCNWGCMCFNWKDVEIVERSSKGMAILHFKSGRSVTAQTDFESARVSFHKKSK